MDNFFLVENLFIDFNMNIFNTFKKLLSILLSFENFFVMIQISYSYKNREFLQLEDAFLNQLAQTGKTLLYALLEPMQDTLLQENGKIRINLDQQPKIELEGFSLNVKEQIEMTLRGEA